MATISSSASMTPIGHRIRGLRHCPPSSPSSAMLPSGDPRAPTAISSSGGSKRPWWSPIFRSTFREGAGSVDPAVGETRSAEEEAPPARAVDAETAAMARRAGLTAEKARVLRREMRATEVWHDAMYHSAIASRLASPDQQ